MAVGDSPAAQTSGLLSETTVNLQRRGLSSLFLAVSLGLSGQTDTPDELHICFTEFFRARSHSKAKQDHKPGMLSENRSLAVLLIMQGRGKHGFETEQTQTLVGQNHPLRGFSS